MQSTLVVCDDIKFLAEEKRLKLGKVLNSIEIPTVPHIYPLFVLIKIAYMSPYTQHFTQMAIYDETKELIMMTDQIIVRNRRDEDLVPGTETFMTITIPFCKPGKYEFQLFIDDTLSAKYPLTVFVNKEA